jgi:hypothetical protein
MHAATLTDPISQPDLPRLPVATLTINNRESR